VSQLTIARFDIEREQRINVARGSTTAIAHSVGSSLAALAMQRRYKYSTLSQNPRSTRGPAMDAIPSLVSALQILRIWHSLIEGATITWGAGLPNTTSCNHTVVFELKSIPWYERESLLMARRVISLPCGFYRYRGNAAIDQARFPNTRPEPPRYHSP
jgi:hypothetical protein